MKLNQHLKNWKQIVSCRFAHLSLPQINGLATWSFGMVMTQSSSLTKVSTLIAKIDRKQDNTVRQRLKEWYKSGAAKTRDGNKRASIEVTKCFSSLLKWVIDLLPPTNQELLIAMDATNIGQNFTVLSINVLDRRCAIPIAWKVVKGTEKGSWKPYWQELFQSCFLNGLLTIVAQLLNGQSLTLGRLFPLPLNHFTNFTFSNSS